MSTSSWPRRRPRHSRRSLAVCPVTGKVRFRDRNTAKQALKLAAFARSRAEIDGLATRRREVRVYQCLEEACHKGFHLSSQPGYTPPGGAGMAVAA
ncbi:hypothetical protein [Intrasporangium sp.]|uniref:hypothetical protein n=1 Tax=Intrasporangium sp. TaxID=1925024 RepID=UPI00322218DE